MTAPSEDTFLVFDEDEVGTPDAPKSFRSPQPYKEGVARVASKAEVFFDEEGLFDLKDATGKPPLSTLYIPQAEVLKLKGTNGLTAISTFSGCEGSGTGFAWAGWDVLASVEFVHAARRTIMANYPNFLEIGPEVVLEAALKWQASDGNPGLTIPVKKEQQRKRMGTIPACVVWYKVLEMLKDVKDGQEVWKDLVSFVNDAVMPPSGSKQPVLWGDDIRAIDPDVLMDVMGLEPGDLDCFEGSPPCQSFSMSGARERKWGQVHHYSDERHQITDDLFWEFARLLDAFRPKTFLAENVAGLTMGEAEEKVMRPLLRDLRSMGYRVEARLLNAVNYGVPQSRPRLFFQGIREDLKDAETGELLHPTWPIELPWTFTVGDALEAAGESPAEELEWVNIKRFEIGKMWEKLGLGASPGNKAFQLRRCHPDQPAPTLTAMSCGDQSSAGPTHPYEPRKFTITEYRWLAGFPTDYQFEGNYDQQGERVGRAVPPYFMRAIAASIADNLKRANVVAKKAKRTKR